MQLDPRKSNLPNPVLDGRVEHVHLDAQVVGQEVGWPRRVGHDAADLGSGQHDDVRTLVGEEGPDRVTVPQVELR